METKEASYVITISANECYEIACDLAKALRQSVECHWVNHLNVNWKEREESSISRLEKFYRLSLYPHMSAYLVDELDNIIVKARAKEAEKNKTTN
jgi:NADH:ubiquinone oxidoreductase subunit C